MEIKEFEFNESGQAEVGKDFYGKDWPVVYLIHDDKRLYIGETTSAYTRFGQHLVNEKKRDLDSIKIVFDETYNKSVILDFEQRLIKYCKADGKYLLLNKNAGQSSQHNYFQRETYSKAFKILWTHLYQMDMVQNSMDIIENKNIFKFSPYTSLTEEQNAVSISILSDIVKKLNANKNGVCVVNGCAGTGKTVLAISLINSIVNAKNIQLDDLRGDSLSIEKVELLLEIQKYVKTHGDLKIGFVFPMMGIRKTIAAVFKNVGNGLSKEMVISPYALRDNEYDILFVDESHRLTRRKNLAAVFGNFDLTCKTMGLDPNEANELDWIFIKSKYAVLFYDEDQSIKPSDVSHVEYQKTVNMYFQDVLRLELTTQMRCQGGESYTTYIKSILNCAATGFQKIENYDFKIFDNVDRMVCAIKELDNEYGLCKTLAGYSWQWKTKPGKTPANNYDYYNTLVKNGEYDIAIGQHRYIWNLVPDDWISRLDSHCTIGCIHTTQGFDLNYAGIIFGREIDYNPETKQIEIYLDRFFDSNVKAGCDEDTVKRYIVNTYSTMLARGIKGCYVYACNKNLKEYLCQFIEKAD